MNTKLKAKWVKALRSGEYEQFQGSLKNTAGTRFCCLGVLKDIGTGIRKARDGNDLLSPATCGIKKVVQEGLAIMNDAGRPFAEIAAFIARSRSI